MRPGFLTLSLAVSLTASSCGSNSAHTPALARADAAPLAALAQRISKEGPCAQRRDIARLQHQAVALVNTRRVPTELQDSLMSGVNALAADSPPCLPAAPPAPAPAPLPPAHGHGKPKPPKHDHHDHKGHHD